MRFITFRTLIEKQIQYDSAKIILIFSQRDYFFYNCTQKFMANIISESTFQVLPI